MRDLWRLAGSWVLVLLAALAAAGVLGRYGWNVVAFGLLYAVLATSWSWMRATGLFSLGQAAFFGTGALAEGWLVAGLHLPTGLALSLAALAGAAVAIPLLPALRLRPPSFALVTLAYAVLLKGVAGNLPGGPEGFLLPATVGFSGLAPLLIASLAVLAVGLTVGYRLFLGRAGGRSAAAIRQAPETAQACGIGLVGARWRPFVGNAAATGLAGALYAHLVGSVEPVVVFAPILSALPLILGMLGGPLNPLGGLAGTLALYPIDELLLRPALPQAHALAYGVALVGLLVLRPGGLLRAQIPAVPAGARVVGRGPLALAAERLRVRLSGATVVEDVTFAVPPGQILGVTGPNGAGKSSLLLALAGALPPARGLVRLNGAAAPRGVAARARVGVARTFQAPQPFPDWTVRENVAIAAEHGGAPGEVAAILDAVQLTPLQDRRAGQLSVGEAKRLELARALALKPAVLLLDEPLAGLSPDGAGAVVREIARVRDGGAAVVWVEHAFDWGELAGQLLVLEDGRVRFQGAPRDWEARRRALPA